MGWGSGVGIADLAWKAFVPYLDRLTKEEVARAADAFVEAFEGGDCDTMQESDHEALRAAARRSSRERGFGPDDDSDEVDDSDDGDDDSDEEVVEDEDERFAGNSEGGSFLRQAVQHLTEGNKPKVSWTAGIWSDGQPQGLPQDHLASVWLALGDTPSWVYSRSVRRMTAGEAEGFLRSRRMQFDKTVDWWWAPMAETKEPAPPWTEGSGPGW